MFVQVISGQVADAAALQTQWNKWKEQLQPDAIGFLGSTAGISTDGRFVALARFESAESARANSERPEQGQWWAETEPFLSGEISFIDSEDVDVLLGGGSDDAGFVQIMEATDPDRAGLENLDRLFVEHASTWRPDLLGGFRVWSGDSYTEAAYFTSEVDAREGEAKEPPAELAGHYAEFEAHMSKATFTDLPAPLFA